MMLEMRCCLIQLCHKLILNSSYLQPGLVGGGLSLYTYSKQFWRAKQAIKVDQITFYRNNVIVYFR